MNRLYTLFVMSALMLTGVASLRTQSAQAQTFSVIHAFTGAADGYRPNAGLTLDVTGNLYGTTAGDFPGEGTAFQLKRTNGNWVLNTISPAVGSFPLGRVVWGRDGTLYGTTEGGSTGPLCEFGCGSVYRLQACATPNCVDPWGTAYLYFFMGGTDGWGPSFVDPVFDQEGNLYGTAQGGGSADDGVVFKLTHSGSGWTQSVIHNFTGEDGSTPLSGVIFDNAGNLYGTTSSGGSSGVGSVYQLTPSGSGWNARTIYSFQGGADGEAPVGGLIFDQSGNLYGTTITGGSGGGGTVFELLPSGGSWTFSVLYSWNGGSGGGPEGSLAIDAAGNLYGAAKGHGVSGAGTVFKLTPTSSGWIYTDLHDFAGFGPMWPAGGLNPVGGVTFDAHGNLYGTALFGGIAKCNQVGVDRGCGVVWEITP